MSAFKNAQALAARGYSVLPIYGIVGPSLKPGENENPRQCSCGRADCTSPGKHPIASLVPRGLKDATTEPNTLRLWHSAFPEANFALATGTLVVLDQDGPDGAASLAKIQDGHRMPSTWRVSTGRQQSRHYYFKAPDGVGIHNSAGRLGKGLDVRGHGGYVVIPGSRHISGYAYSWWRDWHPSEHPVARLPEWLLEKIQKPQSTNGAGGSKGVDQWRELAQANVEHGQRNETITRFAGYLLNGFNDVVVTHALLQAWNATHCVPPLPANEVERVVLSIAERESQKSSP